MSYLKKNAPKQTLRRQFVGWGVVAFMLVICSTAVMTSCNTHSVQYLTGSANVQGRIKTSITNQVTMDILWVIDNSGSMCQEQKVLRDNFGRFIDRIKDTSLDFHIAVTTTHFPGSDVTGLIEPVAKPAEIQSQPQPVPGPNPACLGDVNASDFKPFRDALAGALTCLSNSGNAAQFNWTNEQIACAVRATAGCAAQVGGVDRNNDGVYDPFDLFPDPGEYRTIPKVLKSADYRNADGTLDADRLRADFACMSLVGTRGYGLEKGLQSAVEAVAPAKTGGAVDAMGAPATQGADPGAPNHGFIRRDAGFALVFVTDENDCSHDGTLQEFGNACGGNVCDYENSPNSSANSPLIPVASLAADLKKNLSDTKGRSITEGEILVASIHGDWDRFEGAKPDCAAGDKPPINAACSSPLGEAFSGDRYERFIRQFANFFPNSASQEQLRVNPSFDPKTDFTIKETGWMCAGDFTPALEAIGQYLAGIEPSCVTDRVFPCTDSSECPTELFGENPDACQVHPDDPTRNFCTSGILLKIEKVAVDAMPIEMNTYCLPGSINRLRSRNGLQSCIVDPSKYRWAGCAAASGLTFKWQVPEAQVAQQLAGYELELIYNATISDEGE